MYSLLTVIVNKTEEIMTDHFNYGKSQSEE